MSRARKRADRIREEVPIQQVLADYGYAVDPAYEGEQQYSCDLHGSGQDNSPSARVYPDSGSTYCVSTHERVFTGTGWVRLGDLCGTEGLPVLDGASDWWVPTAYLPKGKKEAICIRTNAGYTTTVTPDHEIAVRGKGWVRATDLQRGDCLVIPKPKTVRFAPNTPLPVEDINARSYTNRPKLNLPLQWSTAVGESLGYVIGRHGWVVPRKYPNSGLVGITASAEDAEDAREIFRHWKTWTSGRGCESHRTDFCSVYGKRYQQNQYVFTVGNDGFCEFFRRLGLSKDGPAQQRRLPAGVWQAPVSGVRGFLRGVFGADGSVFFAKGYSGERRKCATINLYSVSGGFLQDVQLLLLQFGIYSRIYVPSNTRIQEGVRKGKRTHPCWYLQIGRGVDVELFRNQVGFTNARKQRVLAQHEVPVGFSRPFHASVVSTEPVGVVDVADLSMPMEHSFVAGGIKVHNCFACGRTRDSVELTKEKEGIEFWDALRVLEERYGLPTLPWDDEDREETKPRPETIVREALKADETFADDQKRVKALLDNVTRDKDFIIRATFGLWEAFDKVGYLVRGGILSEEKGRLALQKIRLKVMGLLKAPA